MFRGVLYAVLELSNNLLFSPTLKFVMSPKPIVGYWDIRGRGEPIRLILKYAGVDFQDERYSFVRGEMQKSEWFGVKFTLGLDFPKLPYLIDGDVKLTQSLAISRYLARKYKLDGNTEAEKNRVALLEQQVNDLLTSGHQFMHKKDQSAEEKAEFVKNLETQLELVNKFLSTGKYVAGDRVTYVDFWLYEYLRYVNTNEVTAGVLSKYDVLKQFVQRIEALPQVADYLAALNA